MANQPAKFAQTVEAPGTWDYQAQANQVTLGTQGENEGIQVAGRFSGGVPESYLREASGS